jgi:adenine phosphoribosyltransferase
MANQTTTNEKIDLSKTIRDIPDFPKPGIIFKDITTLLKNPKAFKQAVDEIAENFKGKKIDTIVAIESRGFIFGAALAYKLGAAFVPVRKKGKLPYETLSFEYSLEYGTDTLEIHKDAINKGENVILIDDLLATGGTTEAVEKMLENLGANLEGIAFVIELTFLNGREKLKNKNIVSLIKY